MASKDPLTIVAISLLALSACGESPSISQASVAVRPQITPTPVGLETPAGSDIYLGAFVSVSNGNTEQLEQQIGRTVALDSHYNNWISQIIGNAEYSDLESGTIPIESWQCGITDAGVVSGQNDMLINTVAQEIKKYGHAVFLRFMWDMNMPNSYLSRESCWDPNTDNSDGTFSATEYVSAWKHIRKIFSENKVTNAVWVWGFNGAGSNPTPYFPGDSQVDWVGVDAYDVNSTDFSSTLAAAYATAVQFGKPILVTETGALASEQPAFFNGAASTLETQFPSIKGFVYFDAFAPPNQWTLSAPNGVSAFQTFAGSPYMSAMGSP